MNPKGHVYVIALILVIIGAINWGLIAINGTNLVRVASSAVTSSPSTAETINRVVYGLVGIAGLLVLYKDWPLV